MHWKFPKWFSGKESTSQCSGHGSIPGLGTSPGEGNGNSFQCSFLGNPMAKGAVWATVYGVTKESDRTYRLKTNKQTNKQNSALEDN